MVKSSETTSRLALNDEEVSLFDMSFWLTRACGGIGRRIVRREKRVLVDNQYVHTSCRVQIPTKHIIGLINLATKLHAETCALW